MLSNLSQFNADCKSFRLAKAVFQDIHVQCHHISCESTITSSMNGNRSGIKIDKVGSYLIYVICQGLPRYSKVNYFWSIKALPRSSSICNCVTFRVLRYLLSTFLLYIARCHMILSMQKCCLRKRTSVLLIRLDFPNKQKGSFIYKFDLR